MTIFFTPGPAHPYPDLQKFLDDAWRQNVISLSHRGKEFKDIYKRTDNALRRLLDIPDDYSVMFLGSATEAMERIIQGTVEKRSHHFINGAFAEKWYEIARQLGKQPTATRVAPGQIFKNLTAAVPKDAELVCVTQNETSTGSAVPLPQLQQLTKLPGRPLLALDIVSSVPITPVPIDKFDLVFFSVQKAFGLPAGLGVLIASPRAMQKAQSLREKGISIGSYHNLADLAEAAGNYQTPATPNVLGIYLLGRVAEDMLKRGLPALRLENGRRAQLLYKALESSEHLEPFVSEPSWRSATVVVTKVRGGSVPLHDHLLERGIVAGKGYGQFKEDHLRLANFPALDEAMFANLLEHLSDPNY